MIEIISGNLSHANWIKDSVNDFLKSLRQKNISYELIWLQSGEGFVVTLTCIIKYEGEI